MYVDERLPYSFTRAFIDYESERSGMLSSHGNQDSGSIGWSFDILKLFSRESGGEVSIEYQKQLSASSQYWLGSQENRAKLGTAENQVMWKYQPRISQVKYTNPLINKIELVGVSSEFFIKKWNSFIDDHIKKFFDSTRRMNNNG